MHMVIDIPEARFEALISDDVALYDVSHLMPKGRHKRKTHRPKGQPIDALFVHHSGALGRPGLEGALAAARYVIGKRNFPLAPYHYWIPREPVYDPEGRIVIFRLLASEARGWHTGRRANDRGEAVCLQGNASRMRVSPSQETALRAFIPWWGKLRRRPLDRMHEWLGWHAIAHRFGGRRKRACPGRDGLRVVRDVLTGPPQNDTLRKVG